MRSVIFVLAISAAGALHPLPAQPVATYQIRPGIVHTTYHVPGPNVVHVVSAPLRDPRYRVMSFRPERLTTVSEQVSQVRQTGKEVIAAVNADFFSFQTHLPVGIQLAEGHVIHVAKGSIRSQVAITAEGKPNLDRQRFRGQFQIGQSAWLSLDGINCFLDSGQVVLYDGSAGGRLRVPKEARFFSVHPVEFQRPIADTLVFVGPEAFELTDSVWTPKGNVVAFGEGAAARPILIDDTIRVVFSVGVDQKFMEAVGGGGRILFDGRLAGDSIQALERIGKKFTTDRHPRTFVAIDRDSTFLYLCTVDGRQVSSVGMNFAEMAEFLLSIGGWNAVNLDGGGSTAMVIEGKVVNQPSDKTGERAVANSLMIIERDPPP